MGNTNSTTAQAVSPSNTPSRRTTSQSDIGGGGVGGGVNKSKQPTRRKKSIELSDVDTSLSFTSPHGHRRGDTNPGGGRSGRRKNTGLTDTSGSGDDEMEGDAGTLRGAMQGRAEHVVYGPRRDDTLSQNLGSGGGGIISGTSSTNSSRPSTIPRRASDLQMTDPDDTTHPAYKGSPRLTSAVLLSQDRMPVLVSPKTEEFPKGSPFGTTEGGVRVVRPSFDGNSTSLAGVSSSILAASTISSSSPSALLPPHTSAPYPPSLPPTNSVLAPIIPLNSLPLAPNEIPSGTSVIPSPPHTPALQAPSTTSFLLPPTLFNHPAAAIPIPLLSVPSATIAASLLAAAVDLGAGTEGVPTLIKWKDEDGQTEGIVGGKKAKGPKEVFVTGTFSNGWKTKIELRKNDANDFSALISLPPGPHRLKFIVDKEWKASKHLPVATDADGNLINYLHVNSTGNKATAGLDWNSTSTSPSGTTSLPPTTTTSTGTGGGVGSSSNKFNSSPWNILDETLAAEEAALHVGIDSWEEHDFNWTSIIPSELVEWGEWEAEREALELSETPSTPPPPPASSSGVPPPTLPAQLEKGPLNHAAYVTQGSGDDNSILPKPDHSVINHLAASPIKGGFLSVGVTTRYKRKFVTIVYYKALAPRE